MGYREFAKDYKIEYVDRPGHKRPKAVRVYIGPWFRFVQPPEKIRFLKWFYLIGLAIVALMLLIPMCIDCTFTRIWYIQAPAVATVIPWIFAACATWRLWTAGEKMTREHNRLTGGRMKSAMLFMVVLNIISSIGCFLSFHTAEMSVLDYVVCSLYCLSSLLSAVLLWMGRDLRTVLVEQK